MEPLAGLFDSLALIDFSEFEQAGLTDGAREFLAQPAHDEKIMTELATILVLILVAACRGNWFEWLRRC